VKEVDVQLGVGYGFTPGSDRLIFKAIIGYAFPVPGKSTTAAARKARRWRWQHRHGHRKTLSS
jgi:hypothetical protein